MLVKPDLEDEKIAACLAVEFGLRASQIEFLPLGADQDTAVYRIVADSVADGVAAYFLKLRRGRFDATSVLLPKHLSDLGVRQIISPFATRTGQLWGTLAADKVLLYPFVEGCNGYARALTANQWREYGAALRCIHTAKLPPALIGAVQRETFSPRWREIAKSFLAPLAAELVPDHIARRLAAFLQTKRAEICALIARTEQLAQALQTQTLEYIVCHSDLHAGNLLLANDGALYIVDWDAPILAPKERDLMYIGAGLVGGWSLPAVEETLFYQGYGPTPLNRDALTYYRYERIIQDIALFCEQIFLTASGGEDRAQALHYLLSNFESNGVIELARRADAGATM